ncbi:MULTISPECIES: alpha/beta fold hydrolase [Antarcticibacterium]|uniref:alpha/beta fold hydrolase n=1 Tax=Antarcticibacterium TaxID=2058174 RepID=UPI00255AE7B6|nr:alpha/beta hydrolase [Antarcticibacterium sp. W02-3]
MAVKRQVVCIDLPGHGKSGNLGSIHTMEEMALVVKAVLDKLNLNRITLAGHSLGGYVCLSYLDQFATMVNTLLLLNSTPEADTPERIENRNRGIEMIQKNKSAFVRMAISNLVSPKEQYKHKKELDKLKKEAVRFPTSGIVATIEGMKIRTDKTDVLKEFNRRKILVAGKDDSLMPWKRVKSIGEATNTEIILVNTGHLSYLEQPSEIEELLHFID